MGLMNEQLSPDEKGRASFTLGDVIVQTRENFPDPRFRPQVFLDTPQYHLYGINPSPYSIWVGADGIGTKPEFYERIQNFRGVPRDAIAMAVDDDARFGRFTLGVVEVLDTNNATDGGVIGQIAQGLKETCDDGGFALLNGETAELGYRSPGYGKTHVNMNVVSVSLINPDKLILNDRLEPGHILTAVKEPSIRSNGLTMARKILDADYLYHHGYESKLDYINANYQIPMRVLKDESYMESVFGYNIIEQTLLPWHEIHPEIVEQIATPSTLYTRLMYEALGGVNGEKQVDITGAAHISGGGIPEKGKRMVETTGLGLHVITPFSEPQAITSLLDLARNLPNEGTDLIDDQRACMQWNRGIGFLVATRNIEDSVRFIEIAENLGYQAMFAGKVIEERAIKFKGYTWTY